MKINYTLAILLISALLLMSTLCGAQSLQSQPIDSILPQRGKG